MLGTSSIGGLISGLNTTDLISQLMAVSARRVEVVINNQNDHSDKLAAFQSLNTSLSDFKAAAEALKDSDAFNVFKGNTTTTSTNFNADDFLTLSTTTDASPGSHTIEFLSDTDDIAKARQLSSMSFVSKTTQSGLSGDFVINGTGISITSTDSLTDIASKINNANSGTNATGVTASVLTVSSTDHRLIIKSDDTGADTFSLLDASSTNILQSLGLTTSADPSIKNATSDGAQSDEFSNSETAVGSLLGLSSFTQKTVTIAGESVDINLANDSLTDIANNITTNVTGVSASVLSTTTDGVTKYRLDISGTTSILDNDTNVLEALGVLEGSQGSIAEVQTSSKENTLASDGTTPIDATTKFEAINTTGAPGNDVSNGDTITISGTKHDGTDATGSYTITNKSIDTIQGLLTAIETAFGLSAGSATMSGGKIVVTNSTAGDSPLSISISTNNEGSGTLDFGTVSATTEGYEMEMEEGQDASVKIDGVIVSRNTNIIDDVISGVTIDLKKMEAGTVVNLTVSRDTDSIKSSVSDFISAYNTIIESINGESQFDEETETAGALSGESTLSTIKSILQSTITNTISGLPSGSNALSLIGINSDKNGKLSLNDSVFQSKINTDFNAVRRMFIAEGTTTSSEVTYISHTNETVAGKDYAVNITAVGTQATVTGTEVLNSGIGATTDTITIKDTATNRIATIDLNGNPGGNATSLTDIVNTINSELAIERAQVIVGSVSNSEGASFITGSTTFSSINGTTLADKDVISFTGTSQTGGAISNTFTITNTTTNTIQDLLSSIESAYSNTVSATINSSGEIELRDVAAGDSQLSFTISGPSGSGLDFGTVSETNAGGVTGRHAMELTASASGNNFVLTHNNYGSALGFEITELTDTLGAEGIQAGVDVAGTINGENATGVGQILTGDAPATDLTTSIEGLVLRITSTDKGDGDKGTVTLTKGVAEQMFYNIDSIVNSIDGLLTVRMDGLQDSIDNLQGTIDDMEDRLTTEQSNLEYKFVQLELNLARLQSVSSFLSQQLGSLSKLTG
ncbi:MAG: hypothetical protein D8M57_03215 [Candidatus Scalindua sp. AMX11]|nr:MAG: hypothetical protein DWQ00_16775 [Candidatus Scalindua sp.]NOG85876.1 flagellar filament capping protein FliD [Planctomycetota bacterium]RZV96952.1 MAG: hypothetical protein EX341_01855 [Candidatus Scalindua sp. SCAELEC01]TDE66436.1 MAG: hypothetical protein D8M57_03215 [Candidatus Scalindua sp. AMX11]GJQ60187.1 MAG: hypothetical protein SCALA701_29880 [Candidatus Scalindua sp.]